MALRLALLSIRVAALDQRKMNAKLGERDVDLALMAD